MLGRYLRGIHLRTHGLLITLLLVTIASFPMIGAPFETYRSEDAIGHSAPLGPAQDEFPMFRGDPAHTGNVSMDGPNNYDLKWSIPHGGYCSPIVKYDQIYISSSRRVRCYDLNGTNLWNFYTGDVHWSSPLVHAGRVYVTGNSSRLWCLDANATGTGTTTNYWIFTPDEDIDGCTSSPTTDNVRIYYNLETSGNGMVAVWLSNGSQAWNASLDGSMDIESSPSYWNGFVYTGAGNSYSRGSNYLYCFYANNGTLKWKYYVGRPVCSSPAIEYGRVYFGAQDRNVYCLDANGVHGSTTLYWTYACTNNVISSAAVAYGDVYIGDSSRNGILFSLDAFGSGGSTTRNWQTSLRPAGSYGICSSPVVTPNYVYVGTTGNSMYCLDRNTGGAVFSMNHSGGDYGISASPALFSGLLAYTSDDGNMYIAQQKMDLISPQVNLTDPADDAVDVPIDINITIGFNEDIDNSTIKSTNFHLDRSGIEVPASIGYDQENHTVWIKPTNNLTKEARYTFIVEFGVTDLSSNYLDGDGDGVQEGETDLYLFDFYTVPYSEPVVTLTSLRALEDERKIVQLRNYITDEDTPFDELIISENSTYAEIDMGQLILEYPQGIIYDLINLTVEDNINTVHAEIEVLITGENDAPQILELPPINPTEEIDLVLNMTSYVFDPDGDELELFSSSTHSRVENLSIIFNYPEGILSEEVIISVSDGLAIDLRILQVNVTPVNDPPVIVDVSGLVGDFIEVEVEEDDVLTLIVHANDVDGPGVLLVLEDNLDRLIFEPGTGRITNSPIQEDVGNYSIIITAHDGADLYLKDSVTINISVANVNDAPVGGEIELVSGGVENFTVVVRTTVATDEDNDPLTYTWDWGDGDLSEGSIEAEHTYISKGNYTIRVIVSDRIERYIVSLRVTVTPPEEEPEEPIEPVDDDDGNITDDDETPVDNVTKKDDQLDPVFLILIIIMVVLVIIVIASVIFVGVKTRREVWDDDDDPNVFMQRYSRTVREVEE